MTELQERDAMVCRACGNEERASEGYPCARCGTFICVICNLRGVIECRSCANRDAPTPPPAPPVEAPRPEKTDVSMPEWLVD